MIPTFPEPESKKKTSTRSGEEKSDVQNQVMTKAVLSIDRTVGGFTGLLNKKQTKKFQAAQEEYQKKQLLFSKESTEGGKDKNTTKKWKKVVDFLFKGLKGFFKGIVGLVKSLSLSKAAGLLGLLLGLFLMLKLGLLDVVIPAALDLLETLIEGLIGYLPKIVKSLWKLISEDVPKIINTIADALSDALGIKSEPLRDLVKTLTWIVSLGFILNKVMGLFGGNIFSLIGNLNTLFKVFKASKAGLALSKYISIALHFIGGGIKALGAALVANPIGLIILAIVAVLAALYAIWKNAAKISDWFDGLYDKFTKLGTKGKILVGALALLLFPITALTLLIVGIAKLFKSIQEKGIVQTLKDIGTWFTDLFDKIEEKILGLPKPILAVLGALAMPFAGIIAALKGLVKFFKSVKEKGFLNTMKAIWDSISSFFSDFSDIWIELKNAFSDIWDQLSGIWSELKSTFSELGSIFSELFPSSKDNKSSKDTKNTFTTAKKMLETLSHSLKLLFKILKPIISIFVKVIIVGLKMFFGMIKIMLKCFMLFIKALKEIFKLIQRIKKEGLKSVLKKIWGSVNNFFMGIIKSIIKKFQPIADFFTTIGSKIAGFFEPIVSKMKLLFAKISDIVGSMIDSIMFNILKHPTFAKFFGLGDEAKSLEKKGITTVEEYKAVKYATEMASDSDTKKMLAEYKNASKERRTEMESSMTSPQIGTAQAYLEDTAQSIDAYVRKLNEATPSGSATRKVLTKQFGKPRNGTSDNS